MTEQENRKIREALTSCLSGVDALPSMRSDILRAAKGEQKVKRNLSKGLVLALSAVTAAHAAEGTVTYDGKAQEFIFAPGSKYSPTDLFPDFKDVMPGDSLVQKITLKNEASNKVKVNIYLRSVGSHPDSRDFLSQLQLRVKMSRDNDMSYMFDAAASESAQLSDWVCLGTLYSGGVVNLDVILDVPVELDNQYQSQIGYIGWEFKIEELPIEPTDPEPPKTGDDAPIFLWAGMMIVSFSVLLLLILMKKRKEREEN